MQFFFVIKRYPKSCYFLLNSILLKLLFLITVIFIKLSWSGLNLREGTEKVHMSCLGTLCLSKSFPYITFYGTFFHTFTAGALLLEKLCSFSWACHPFSFLSSPFPYPEFLNIFLLKKKMIQKFQNIQR